MSDFVLNPTLPPHPPPPPAASPGLKGATLTTRGLALWRVVVAAFRKPKRGRFWDSALGVAMVIHVFSGLRVWPGRQPGAGPSLFGVTESTWTSSAWTTTVGGGGTVSLSLLGTHTGRSCSAGKGRKGRSSCLEVGWVCRTLLQG